MFNREESKTEIVNAFLSTNLDQDPEAADQSLVHYGPDKLFKTSRVVIDIELEFVDPRAAGLLHEIYKVKAQESGLYVVRFGMLLPPILRRKQLPEPDRCRKASAVLSECQEFHRLSTLEKMKVRRNRKLIWPHQKPVHHAETKFTRSIVASNSLLFRAMHQSLLEICVHENASSIVFRVLLSSKASDEVTVNPPNWVASILSMEDIFQEHLYPEHQAPVAALESPEGQNKLLS